ncbi:MAG: hypothetical protein ABL936_11665 [Aestuariivirga sp.]
MNQAALTPQAIPGDAAAPKKFIIAGGAAGWGFGRAAMQMRQGIEIFKLSLPNTVRHLTNKNAPEMIAARFQIVMWITLRRKGPGCG